MAYSRDRSSVYKTTYIRDAIYKLYVHAIDFELFLVGSDRRSEYFAVNKYTLEKWKETDRFPELLPLRRYYLRYNNNDRGPGILDIEIHQIDPYGEKKIVYWHKNDSIYGPQVIEFPILFHPERGEPHITIDDDGITPLS